MPKKKSETELKPQYRMLPSDAWIQMQKMQDDEEFRKAVNTNVNMIIYPELIARQINGQNFIISICGGTGTGKSEAGQGTADFKRMISGVEFDERNIAFSQKEMVDKLRRAKKEGRIKNATFILDEQTEELGQGSTREQNQLKNIEETIRIEQANFIYISPTPKSHLHQYIFKTQGEIDYKREISKVLVYKVIDEPDGTQIIKLLGYITVRRASEKIRKVYLKRKRENVSRVLAGENEGRTDELEAVAKKISQTPQWLSTTNFTQRLFVVRKATKDKYTTGENRQLVELCKMIQSQMTPTQILNAAGGQPLPFQSSNVPAPPALSAIMAPQLQTQSQPLPTIPIQMPTKRQIPHSQKCTLCPQILKEIQTNVAHKPEVDIAILSKTLGIPYSQAQYHIGKLEKEGLIGGSQTTASTGNQPSSSQTNT